MKLVTIQQYADSHYKDRRGKKKKVTRQHIYNLIDKGKIKIELIGTHKYIKVK